MAWGKGQNGRAKSGMKECGRWESEECEEALCDVNGNSKLPIDQQWHFGARWFYLNGI